MAIISVSNGTKSLRVDKISKIGWEIILPNVHRPRLVGRGIMPQFSMISNRLKNFLIIDIQDEFRPYRSESSDEQAGDEADVTSSPSFTTGLPVPQRWDICWEIVVKD